jgi:hypothetical protein
MPPACGRRQNHLQTVFERERERKRERKRKRKRERQR